MDFGAFPPEINSARMYAGAGAGPMMAAATAWSNLAAELNATAAGYESVISELTGGQWIGPASATMAAAVQPYIEWLNVTAAQAQHAAAQATASAAAFEAAFAATVPPPAIAANRAQLAALVATNFLGVNTPAIMATEAHYGEMWAQDAAAMYAYAASSAAAGRLIPMTPPAPTANPAGEAGQAAAVARAGAATATQAGLTQTISNLPNTVAGLAAPLAADPPSILSNSLVSNTINGAVNTTAWWVMNTIPTSVLLNHTLTPAAAAAGAGPGAVPIGAPALVGAAPASTGFGGAPVLAGVGRASTVGGLSVPGSWSAAAPAMHSGASALEGSGWTVAPEESAPVSTVAAGMPAMATAGKGVGFAGPRYGFKPTVMPKSVVV
ncbi:PPE family protein [Mycobacterium sp. 663a-19]|uniref:PPE family protein n=1 Tax=Mycobacterium sp. 663a-19 TaxID=2986148 RepID=UPI002D1F4C1F|nr:PPE family protein [Mycobacterium sp. 663a-19]MEB3982544.1 PPE family protein [Mycobacterium sp. 663a-19]